MKALEKIKSKLSAWKIKELKKSKNHIPKVCNLNDAKSVGILFDATYPVSYEIVKEFAKSLTERNIEVNVLGFVDSEQLIDHYLYRKGFDFFTIKELNMLGIPESEKVNKFTQTDFDILICLQLHSLTCLEYVTIASEANFKTGKDFKNQYNYCDLVIDTSTEIETMHNLRKEIAQEYDKLHETTDNEFIQNRAEYEIELRALIHEITHYLELIKNKLQ